MIKVDLHAHSTHSRHPSDWFLQRLGAQESYTAVEDVYQQAKARGMSLVTLTDHNTIAGALELVARHPADTFISVESTAYFPENGCKVHVLAYAISPAQFAGIDQRRQNIYELREYLRSEDIACAVAHPLFSVNGRLDPDILEKLILLFDVFEGVNGGRSRSGNDAWVQALQQLAPGDIDRLHRRHGIAPWGARPWGKGFTAGSDDHAGLFVGETFTTCPGRTVADLAAGLRARTTQTAGRHGGYKTVAFAVYKIAHDFYQHQTHTQRDGLWPFLSTVMFGDGRLGLRHWLALQKLRWGDDVQGRLFARFFDNLAVRRAGGSDAGDDLINSLYENLTTLSDDFFTAVVSALGRELKGGNAGKLLQTVASVLPVMFLSAPFLTTLRHLHKNAGLIEDVRVRFGGKPAARARKVLWFSDTVLDLNGVSVTMQALANCAHATGRPMQLVTCVPDEQVGALPPNTINLPCIYTNTPSFYTSFTLRVPSLLRTLDLVTQADPDAIVVSTPGPVGVMGLALARLMGIPCTGVYHTDFTRQVDLFIGDDQVSAIVETATREFFRMMDELRVPTRAYMDLLEARGLDRSRMKIFHRCIEPGFAVEDNAAQDVLRQRHGLGNGPILLWAGRVGNEKNLDFLLAVVGEVLRARPDARFVMAGDGPELARLREQARLEPRLVFAGRVPRTDLPHYYALADVFVFPSTTDTYGMVILEAQACGVPAVVTNVGGPQEIVQRDVTGYVLDAGDRTAWVQQTLAILDRKAAEPEAFSAWRQQIRARFHSAIGWEGLLDDMLGAGARPRVPERRRREVPQPEREAVLV